MAILGETIVILIILLFYLVAYYLIHRLAKPYKTEKFKILERVEKRLIILHISNTLMAAIWISTFEERSKFVGWLIFIYVLLSNRIFFSWWAHDYFIFLKEKIKELFMFVQKKFKLNRIKISIKTEPSGKMREKKPKYFYRKK